MAADRSWSPILVFPFSIFLFLGTPAVAEEIAPAMPDAYRLPFVIPGAGTDRELPRDPARWIPKAIAMRFGEQQLLYDPETASVRGWWKSGTERIKRLKWGTRYALLPEDALLARPGEGSGFRWVSQAGHRALPSPAWRGYRRTSDGAVEVEWEQEEGEMAARVIERFQFSDFTWKDVKLEGVERFMRAAAPGGGKERASGLVRIPMGFGQDILSASLKAKVEVKGLPDTEGLETLAQIRRIVGGESDPHGWSFPGVRQARFVMSTSGGGVALDFEVRRGEGATLEFEKGEAPGAGPVMVWRCVVDPEAEWRVGYYRFPAGVDLERAFKDQK